MPEWYRSDVIGRSTADFHAQEKDYRTIAPALKELEDFCGSIITSFDLVADLATGYQTVPVLAGEARSKGTSTVIESREPRQVILATLLTGLAAGVGGLIWGSSHSSSQTDETLIKNQRHLIQVLRKDEHRGKLNEKAIEILKKVVSGIIKHEATQASQASTAYTVLTTMINHGHDVQHLLGAIKELLLRNKFSPNLFHKDQLRTKMDGLHVQANLKGLELGIKTELDFFKCPASYATFANLTIRGVAHIPVVDPQAKFQLLRYVATPLHLQNGNDTMLVEVQHEKSFLAITEDGDRYATLTQSDVDRCQRFSTHLVCPALPVTLTHRSPGCLLGLYSRNHTMVAHQCALTTVPQVPQAWPLNGQRYPDSHIVVASKRFQGLVKIFIPPFCYGHNGYLTLHSTSHLAAGSFTLKIPSVDLSIQHLRSLHPIQTTTNELLHALKQSAPITFHDPSFLPLAPPPSTIWTFLPHGLGGLAVLLIIILVLVLFWRYKTLRTPAATTNINVSTNPGAAAEPKTAAKSASAEDNSATSTV